MRGLALGLLALMAGGCATIPPVDETYAQRSDLELFRSLADLGALSRVEDGCNGLTSDASGDRWIARYYRREQAIRELLGRIHGPAALEGADEITVHPMCRSGKRGHYWRTQYEGVLSLLEQRLAATTTR
jgi:hypothetical protein